MSDGSTTTQGQIFIFVVGTLITALIVGLVTWVKKKIGCQDKIDARSLRQSHAMVWQAKYNDDITKMLHPDVIVPTSADQMEKLLKDEFGNF